MSDDKKSSKIGPSNIEKVRNCPSSITPLNWTLTDEMNEQAYQEWLESLSDEERHEYMGVYTNPPKE